MQNVLIVAYLLIVIALIAVILLQRSEGGGLGMGSSNSNGLVSVRGTANLLTRTTAILATLFFAAAIGLTILTELDRGTSSIIEGASQNGEAPTSVLDALQQMQQGSDLAVPTDTTTAPAATDGAATPAAPATGSDLAVPAESAPATTETAPATTETAPGTTETPAAPAN